MGMTNPAKDAYINLQNMIDMGDGEKKEPVKQTGLLSATMPRMKKPEEQDEKTQVLSRVAAYMKTIQTKRQELKNGRERNSSI